ncbi:MAG: hypothetical protein WD355_06470 [Balneolaceae bacterium]
MKIGFIIQARMQSTRLKGKVLLPLPLKGGKPMLQWIVDQARRAELQDVEEELQCDIIVATSVNPENDLLEGYCKNQNIHCFRGDEEDVLSRFVEITRAHDFDVVVRLTGDNPLLDIPALEQTVEQHLREKNDYTTTMGLPKGMNIECISPEALLNADTGSFTPDEKEHVTLFLKNREEYTCGICDLSGNGGLEDLRMTVDYPSDYALLSVLLDGYNPNLQSGLELVSQIFGIYPWLFEVNRNNIQKQQFGSAADEVEAAVELLRNLGMDHSADLLGNRDS